MVETPDVEGEEAHVVFGYWRVEAVEQLPDGFLRAFAVPAASHSAWPTCFPVLTNEDPFASFAPHVRDTSFRHPVGA